MMMEENDERSISSQTDDGSVDVVGTAPLEDTAPHQPPIFKVYKRRWMIMLAVVLLNISNAAIWITYAPVASTVANFYDKHNGEVNYFSVSYLLVSIPFCFISTFAVNKVGLGVAIHAGAALNCVGAVIKAVGTSTFITSTNTQFAISLTGQVIAAMAQSFLLFIPTKVSQIWFPEHQRTISTTVLSMSNPLGIVLAQIITPAIVKEAKDVTLNNYVWMGVAAAAQLCTLIFVTRSKPPTPASQSSEDSERNSAPYLKQLATVLTCFPYLLLLFMIGFGIAYLSAMATVTQQMLCGLGYSQSFSGLVTGLLIIVGFAGSAAFGVYVDHTKQFTPVCKICYACAALMGIAMMEFYLQPHQGAAILIFSSLFGFFGVGGYPIGLELAVEATYPVEETISTAFIFLSGQLQGAVMIALIGWLSTEQKPQFEHLQVCNDGDHGDNGITPKDYSMSMVALMCILTVLVSLLITFFDTPYKRQEADRSKQLKDDGVQRNSSTVSTPIDREVSTDNAAEGGAELGTRSGSPVFHQSDIVYTTSH